MDTLNLFENNPDRSIIEILGRITNQGEKLGDDQYAVINQTMEMRAIGVDGYPVSNLFPTNPEQELSYGVKLVRAFDYKEYVHSSIVMNEEDNNPKEIIRNGVQEVIDQIRAGKRTGLSCHNKDHMVDFYVRKGYSIESKPKGVRDELDIMFSAHEVDMEKANILMMRFSILQKIVAICTGLVPGKICANIAVAYANSALVKTNEVTNRSYREFYYKVDEPKFRFGMTQLLINNDLMNKWRSQIPEIYPNLSDFKEDGTDFQIVE